MKSEEEIQTEIIFLEHILAHIDMGFRVRHSFGSIDSEQWSDIIGLNIYRVYFKGVMDALDWTKGM